MGPLGVLGTKVGLKWALRFLGRGREAFRSFPYVPTRHDGIAVEHGSRLMPGNHHGHLIRHGGGVGAALALCYKSTGSEGVIMLDEERRRFLKQLGKAAIYTAPVISTIAAPLKLMGQGMGSPMMMPPMMGAAPGAPPPGGAAPWDEPPPGSKKP